MLTVMAGINTVASLFSLLSQNTDLFKEVLKCFEAFYILMHATIFIMALINLSDFDLPYLLLFVSHGITFVQVITLDAWPHKRRVITTDDGHTNITMRPHQIVFAHLVGICVFTASIVYRVYARSLPGLTESECATRAPLDWCTPAGAVGVLDSAGIHPDDIILGLAFSSSTAATTTTAAGGNAAADASNGDTTTPGGAGAAASNGASTGGEGADAGAAGAAADGDGESWGSYFNVFGDKGGPFPYTGWASDEHGWSALHEGGQLEFLNMIKLAQTSGTTILVFLSRHLTKRLADPDVCVLLKCAHAVTHPHTLIPLPLAAGCWPLAAGRWLLQPLCMKCELTVGLVPSWLLLQGQDLRASIARCHEVG
jgi:hypothetical protein